MHSEQCPDCGKWVYHKPLLGTLHFCLSPEERAEVRRARLAVEMQKRASANPYAGLGAIYGQQGVEK